MSKALDQLKWIIGSDFPDLAEHILAMHAHELAEKIRADVDRRTSEGQVSAVTMRVAANLIDPSA